MNTRALKPFLVCMAAGCIAVAILVMLLDFIPCKSSEAVGSEESKIDLSCGEKAIRFWLRHRDLKRMVAEASQGETDPQRRVLNLLEWTRKTVRPVPLGLPVIDDHIPYVVLRRYGTEYQLAEVFTTLAFYAGHESRWDRYTPSGADAAVALSFVRSERSWWVFDVRNGGWFETRSGKIATINDFSHPEQLRRRGQAPEVLNGTPYLDYFKDLDRIWKRSFSRARGQMPWHRLFMELGLEPDDSHWSPSKAS